MVEVDLFSITHDEKNELDAMEEAARNAPHLVNCRTLVLNADGQPISYQPLSTVPWTKVMFWLVKGWGRESDGEKPIVQVLETYPDRFVETSNRKIPLPSVVMYTEMQPLPKKVPATRFNIMLRDEFTCQYSGVQLPPSELNFDHVVPRSSGGETTWDNIVTAAKYINTLKGDMSLKEFEQRCQRGEFEDINDPRTKSSRGWRLRRKPKEPSPWQMREIGRKFPPRHLHESWQDYLYWDSPLEKS